MIIIGPRSLKSTLTPKIASQRLPLNSRTIQRFASELMWLLVLLLRATVAQFPTTLRLEKAMVETGDSEICQVHSLDATKRFSKARPVLGSSGAWVEYVEVVS